MRIAPSIEELEAGAKCFDEAVLEATLAVGISIMRGG